MIPGIEDNMAVLKGKENTGTNVKKEIKQGKPVKQAVAIALNFDRKK